MKRAIFFLLIATLTLTACGAARSFQPAATQAPAYGFGGGAAPSQPDAFAPAPMALEAKVLNQSDVTSTGAAPQTRKVIKNDQLSLVVKDPEQSMKDIVALAEKMGGYVISSYLYQSYYGPNNKAVPAAQVVVRVPAEKLTDALDQIKKGAVEVQSENLTGQDVTDQYVDLQSRLTAKQAAADQLLKIMQNATDSKDVLAIYQELERVQSEIEVLKGQIKYIDQSTATSEINVTLVAEESIQPIEIGGWKLQGTARDAVQDLINFLQGFTRFLIRFLLYNLWVLLLIGLPIYGVFAGFRALFRRMRKPKVKPEPKADQIEEVKK